MSAGAPQPPRGLFAAWAGLVTARPWLVLAVTFSLTAVCLYSALQLEPATGVQDMLADDQPAAIAFGKVIGHYALVDDLVVLARLPEGDHQPDPDRLIGFAQRLEQELENEPMVDDLRYRPSAEAKAFVQQVVVPHGVDYMDPSQRQALRDRLTAEAMDEQFAQNAAMLAAPGPAAGRLAKQLIRDPLRLRDFLSQSAGRFGAGASASSFMDGVDAMVSPDGTAIMIRIAGAKPASDLPFTAEFMPRIRAAAQAANTPTNANAGPLRIDTTGAYAIAEHSATQTRSDMIRSCLGSVALLVVLFLVLYRHPLAFWILKLPVSVAIISAFGVYVGLAGRLTPVTAVAGAVLAGLGIDYCVHYLAHHEAERKRDPAGGDRAAGVRTAAAVGPAIMAACVTSLIGFGAVLSSSVRSLREFAMLGMLGLAMALLSAVTVLPAFLAGLGPTRLGKQGLSSTRVDVSPAVMQIAKRPKRFLLGSLIVCGLAGGVVVFSAHDPNGWHAPIPFDSDLHALHPRPHPPLDTQETLAEVFGAAPNSLMILIEAESPPAMLGLSAQVQDRLSTAALPFDLAGVFGPATLLPPQPTTQPALDIDLDAVTQSLRAAASKYGYRPAAFTEYEDFLATLLSPHDRPGFDELWNYPQLAGLVLPKDQPQPKQGLVLATLAQPWRSVHDRNQTIDAVREQLADLPGATLTGISVIGYDTQRAIGSNLTTLLLIAAGLVVVWLTVFFRNPRDLVLALLPAAAALLALLACAGLFGWTLNAINLIALPLVVGIGVDDGIFLVAIARRAQRQHHDNTRLVEDLAASAHAVCMTSLTTGLAFGSLALTSVPAIRSLGMFTAVGVGAALLASLLTLVPLLTCLYTGPTKTAKGVEA